MNIQILLKGYKMDFFRQRNNTKKQTEMTSGTLESEPHGGFVKTLIAVGPSSQVILMFPVKEHTLRTTTIEVESLNESLQVPYFV